MEYEGEWGSGGCFAGESGIVVRDVETDEEDGKDVEDEDTPEYIFHYTRKILRGVFGFPRGYSDGFGAAV